MKNHYVLACLLALAFATVQAQPAAPATGARTEMGNLVMENIPAIPQALKDRLTAYQNTRGASFVDWDEQGGGMLIATRFGEASQIHRVEKPAGMRYQLTFFPEPVGNASMSNEPGKRGFIISKDIGGNEYRQTYWFNLNDGSIRLLTDGKSQNSLGLWNRKANRYVYTSTRRNGKDYDLYLGNTDNADHQLLLQVEGSWGPVSWSFDDAKLVVSRYLSANESYMHLLDVATGKLTPINPSTKKIAYSGAAFAKDGKGIYLVSDEDTEFQTLRYLDLATGKQTPITAAIPWDVDEIEMTEDGSTLAFIVNNNGASQLYLLNTATNQYKPVTALGVGQAGGLKFDRAGKRLAFSFNNARTSGDAFVYYLADGTLERWTYSEMGGLNPARFVEPQLFSYPTFDKVDGKPRTIPAYIYKPAGAKGPVPVIINIHGGPEAQYQPGFNYQFQYLANEMGIAVIAPNVRGSSGYGKSYLLLDNGYKREESVQDIGTLLDWIATQPDLDAKRVAVWGGSYGGYMTLASMTHFSDRLKCGIDVVGISNFVTFLESTSEYRRDLRRPEYGDERDPQMRAFQLKISPLNNVQKITKPMFIVQGFNDPRVPYTEAEQMLASLKKNNIPAWFLMAKDEGHGFAKKSNVNFYQYCLFLFLEQHLLK
jgi:dipeptidyl aminopeptidase/acylaminoacyl peptidase